MTALVVIENADILDEVIVMDEAFNNLNGYAKAGFLPGDKVTYEDLLYGLMLSSGAELIFYQFHYQDQLIVLLI